MAKVIILNYGADCVDTAIIPDNLETTEMVEDYLTRVLQYHMSEISYMVHSQSNIVPVFKAGEYSTKVFI